MQDVGRNINDRPAWILVAIIPCLIIAFVAALWWNDVRVHVYRRQVSPDGTWSVAVVRQKSSVIPFMEGINVTVQVDDAAGNVLTRRVIDNVDIWSTWTISTLT